MSYLYKIILDDSRFTSPIKKAAANAAAFESSIAKVSKATSSMFAGLGTRIMEPALNFAENQLSKAFTVPTEFEAQMSKVKAATGVVGDEFNTLKNEAMRLGASTKFSATEAAQGLENLAKAGFNSKQSISAIPGVLNLAAASGIAIADAASIAGNTLNAFGISADDTARVVDVLARAVNTSNSDMTDFAEAMKYLAPTAKTLGVSLEESAALIGNLADMGLRGSVATATISTSLGNLAAPSKAAATEIQKAGVRFYDANGKFVGFGNMLKELEKKLAGYSDQQKLAFSDKVFGEAGRNIMSLMNLTKTFSLKDLTKQQQEFAKSIIGKDAFEKAAKSGGEIKLKGSAVLEIQKLGNMESGGFAEKQAKTMADNLAGDLDNLSSAFDDVLIRMSSSGDGFARNIVQQFTQFLGFISSGMSSLANNPALTAFSKGITSFAESVFSLMGNFADVFTVPIGMLIGGIGLALQTVAAFNNALSRNETLVRVLGGVFLGLAVGVGVYTLAMKAKDAAEAISYAWSMRTVIAQGLKAGGLSFLTGSTMAQTMAQWGLNAAMLASPIFWIPAAIVAVGAAFYVAYQQSQVFRAFVSGLTSAFVQLWEVLKNVGKLLIAVHTFNFKGIKEGLVNLVDSASKVGDAFNQGYDSKIREEADAAKKAQAQAKETKAGDVKKDATSVTNALDDLFKPDATNKDGKTPPGPVNPQPISGVGGGGVKNIVFNNLKLVEVINITVNDAGAAATDIKAKLTDALLSVVNDVNIAE